MSATCPAVKFRLSTIEGQYYRVDAEVRGVRVGVVKGRYIGGKTMSIIWSHVEPEYRHCGLGTRMYARLAKQACALGARLQSDTARSRPAEAFWAKQVTKGRATCDPGRGDLYIDANPGDPASGAYFDSFWPCQSYTLKCPVTSLKGSRARR